MNIHGIGTDIVKCDRIATAWRDHGLAFARRILSESELSQLQQITESNQAAFLAKRFAAKEAIVKALGTGFRDDVLLTQISINNDQLGKPSVEFLGSTKKYLEKLGKISLELSIADEAEYIVAFAIAIRAT